MFQILQKAVPYREAKQWQAAMNREIKSINGNNTWELVDKPEKEVLDVKWIYSKKDEYIYKTGSQKFSTAKRGGKHIFTSF